MPQQMLHSSLVSLHEALVDRAGLNCINSKCDAVFFAASAVLYAAVDLIFLGDAALFV
jgi:hypothetical protein